MSLIPLPCTSKQVISTADLGKGFKLNVKNGDPAIQKLIFKRLPDENDIEEVVFNRSVSSSTVIDSTAELKKDLAIEGSLSVAYGPMISGEGAGHYLSENMTTSRSSTLIYKTTHLVFARRLVEQSYKEGAEAGLATIFNGSADAATKRDFAEQFGTHCVDQIIYGGTLELRFTITSDDDVNMQDIMAELKGSIGVGILKVGFAAKFKMSEKTTKHNLKLTITAKSVGADMFCPPNPSFEQACELVKSWNVSFETKKTAFVDAFELGKKVAVTNKMSPVYFRVSPTSSHMQFVDSTTASRLERQMSKLAETMQTAMLWHYKLVSAKSIVNKAYGTKPKLKRKLQRPFNRAVEPVLTKLDEKIDECLLYRQRSIDEILKTKPPTISDPDDDDVILGLIGLGYLEDPATGGEFEGYVLNNEIFMSGEYTYADGGVYKGAWLWKKAHGKGKQTYANGDVYEGQWQDGARHGEGKQTYANGDVYEGQWQRGEKRHTLMGGGGSVAAPQYLLVPGATPPVGYEPITSWQEGIAAAKSLGYSGDSVAYGSYAHNDPGIWGSERPKGMFKSTGNGRFHFNCGPGGGFLGDDQILVKRV